MRELAQRLQMSQFTQQRESAPQYVGSVASGGKQYDILRNPLDGKLTYQPSPVAPPLPALEQKKAEVEKMLGRPLTQDEVGILGGLAPKPAATQSEFYKEADKLRADEELRTRNPKMWRELHPPRKEGGTEGTWTLDEDPDTGKAVLFNSKTGEKKSAPTGLAKSGTFAKKQAEYEKTVAPIKTAMDYATTYLQNGVFTGSSDEALMEKFFDVVKPSSGFRMTGPQMQMLKESRGWTTALDAKARHMLYGTWFGDPQRAQIVKTINDVGTAKLAALAAKSGLPANSDSVIVVSPEDLKKK
jgi:hypothetical protein